MYFTNPFIPIPLMTLLFPSAFISDIFLLIEIKFAFILFLFIIFYRYIMENITSHIKRYITLHQKHGGGVMKNNRHGVVTDIKSPSIIT